MERRITAAALILFASCGGIRLIPGSDRALSHAQYQSLEPGMAAQAIVKAFGPSRGGLQQDGKVRGLTYACEDASGQVHELRMLFSADEKLESWVLRDPKAPEPAK